MEKLGVRMHGITLNLESNQYPLIAYAAEHLNTLAVAPHVAPNLVVRCIWSQGDWDPEHNPFPADGALNVIGKRMLGNNHELIWLDTLRVKGMQLSFRREGEQWVFDISYRFHPKKEKIENLPEYEYKKYFSLMSYAVYYPLMWYLETFRNWTYMHASALATPKGGVLIGGLGGVGKTTTCVALVQKPGVELISENIVFTDGDFVYPCYEPIRLDEGSLKMLGENPPGLSRMLFPEGLKDKSMFHLKPGEHANQVKPAVFLLPQFSPQRYLRPIAPELAMEKMVAMNRLTRELDDYAWYASALEMHWPQAGQAANRLNVLQRFTNNARCYELGIDRWAGVNAVVEDILGCLE